MTGTSTKVFGAVLALSLVAPALAQDEKSPRQDISFGDDTSQWAFDGECDDVRFVGENVAESLTIQNIGKDATDCEISYSEGRIQLNPLFAPITDSNPIDFGNNRSQYADNGVCDDIRFTGKYAADVIYIVDDIGRDANDCRADFERGVAVWQGNTSQPYTGLSPEEFLRSLQS
ncbi:MAG: hypothetical protein ABJP48_02785 [Erythrobacter sp.]